MDDETVRNRDHWYCDGCGTELAWCGDDVVDGSGVPHDDPCTVPAG